jgi:hypothetical protein
VHLAIFPPIAPSLDEVHQMRTQSGPVIVNQSQKVGEPLFIVASVRRRKVEDAITHSTVRACLGRPNRSRLRETGSLATSLRIEQQRALGFILRHTH